MIKKRTKSTAASAARPTTKPKPATRRPKTKTELFKVMEAFFSKQKK